MPLEVEWLDKIKKEKRLLLSFLGLTVISLLISSPRFSEGVPMGVDSSSHVFQVLYLYESFKSTGKIPLWCTYWYCGFPFLLFYPPLSYLLAFTLALAGVSPILSYKIVETSFFVATPFTIYFLARTLNLGRREALVAAFAFNLIPGVMANLIFWDRYPTVAAIPLVALLSAFLIRYLKNEGSKDLIMTTLTFSLLLLTHHFSAYCAALAALLISASYLLLRRNWETLKRVIKVATFTAAVSSLLAAFWLIPFLGFSNYLSNNPFTNGDVWDSFLPPEHWDKMLYKFHNLGLMQWLLATYALAFFVACWIDKGHTSPRSRLICSTPSLFALSALLIGPLYVCFHPIELILISAVSVIVPTLLISSIRNIGAEGRFPVVMSFGWFFIFAWLGFGSHALLFQLIPYWQRLDTFRFALYACIPECILVGKLSSVLASAKTFKEGGRTSASQKPRFSPKIVPFLLVTAMLVANTFVGYFVIADDFSYRSNGAVSAGVIEYFKKQEDQARILPIRCPEWVFILPLYADKPIVDGWYPQAKVLPLLVDIDDYTLNELSKTYGDDKNESARIAIWRTLISEHSLLGIEWVMIPEDVIVKNETLSSLLMGGNQDFQMAAKIDGILIYETKASQSLVQTEARLLTSPTWRPDKITIILDTNRSAPIVVKEAYFPEWTIQTNASSAQLTKDDNGFIKIQIAPVIDSNVYEVNLVYERSYEWHLYLLSTLAFLSLMIGYITFTWRKKKWRLKNGK